MRHAIRRSRLTLALAAALALGAGCVSSSGPAPGEPAVADAVQRARVHYDLGVDHLRNGEPALALRELLEAERLEPQSERVELALAEAYRSKGRGADAEAHYLRALAIKPDFQDAHMNLSAFYIENGRYQEAIPHAERLIDDPTFPAPWRALLNLGTAEMSLGRLDAARGHLQRALDYREEFWRASLALGILEAQAGNPEVAIDHFERVLAERPGALAEAEVHYRLAQLHVALGQREQAISHLTEARNQRPSGPWGKRSEEYLKLLQ
jgi:type IV pilus assembly protein PilF